MTEKKSLQIKNISPLTYWEVQGVNLALEMNGSKNFYQVLIKPSLFLLFYHCFLCIDFILRQDLCTWGQSWPPEAYVVCKEQKLKSP